MDELSGYRFLEPLVYIWDCAGGGNKRALDMRLGLLDTVMRYKRCSSDHLTLRHWIDDIRRTGTHYTDERT